MARASATQIASAAKAAGFTGADVAIAVAVALAESGGETTATHKNSNGSTDYGVWQINSIHADILRSGSWSNINDNARMAKKIHDESGSWKPWSTFNSGSYLKFLGTGKTAGGSATAVDAGLNIPGLGALESVGKFALFISDPHNWLRTGLFLAGFILLTVAIFKMTGDNQLSGTTKAVVGAATKAVAL
jgi:Lysozyme like domain